MLFSEKEKHINILNLTRTILLILCTIHLNLAAAQTQEARNAASLVPVLNLLLDEPTQLVAGSFSGDISLPEGILAGIGGVTFTLKANMIDFEFIDGVFTVFPSSVDVTIPEGMNRTSYFLQLNSNTRSETKSLSFNCKSGCDDLNITTDGDWSESIGVGGLFSRTNYPSRNQNIVNILLEEADTFSGTVSLPMGVVASGEESIIVIVSETTGFLKTSFSYTIRPVAGEVSWPFKIGVPTDSSTPNWNINIRCLACDNSIPLDTQYASQVSGSPLTLNSTESHPFPADVDQAEIDMRFLQVP